MRGRERKNTPGSGAQRAALPSWRCVPTCRPAAGFAGERRAGSARGAGVPTDGLAAVPLSASPLAPVVGRERAGVLLANGNASVPLCQTLRRPSSARRVDGLEALINFAVPAKARGPPCGLGRQHAHHWLWHRSSQNSPRGAAVCLPAPARLATPLPWLALCPRP